MSDKPLEMELEQAHFHMCQEIIQQNIARYQKEYAKRHAQVIALHKDLNSGDRERYNDLMTAASLEEQAERGLRKNLAAAVKPYFGRIDYIDKNKENPNREHPEQVYIGKNGVFRNKTEVLIADWRAPISSVYYENELGEGEYGLPDDGKNPIDLKLKRTYDITDSQLEGYYDSNVASNDELLVKYLSRNKDVVLGEIIATIQQEQNAIIRETPFANLIVQGVAGSGKTTVAVHRISYLLYNYRDRFESNEYCIIGSNDLLLNYITSGLPELDVPDIKHMRMDQLFIRLCEKEWTKKKRKVSADETAKYRCTLGFMRALDRFLLQKRLEIVNCKALIDPQIGTILTKSANLTLLKENPHFSIDRLLITLDERVKTRIQFLMSGADSDRIQIKLNKYNGYYKAKKPKASSGALYHEFLTLWAQENQMSALVDSPESIAFQKHIKDCAAANYDLYDIAALSLIHYRVHQEAPNEEFGLLFLDEAQDFGIGIYYVLKKILPDTYFTIMGDVSQNINYDTGINDWQDLTNLFLTEEKDKFLQLRKSYRNTIEISEYAGKILERAGAGQHKITPVIRHGLPVSEEEYWSDVEMAQRIGELVEEFRQKGYSTTAVICRTDEEAAKTSELLDTFLPETENLMVLPIHMVKGLEFDTVILWNPDMKNGLKRPDTAKLLYVAATRALHELYVLQC